MEKIWSVMHSSTSNSTLAHCIAWSNMSLTKMSGELQSSFQQLSEENTFQNSLKTPSKYWSVYSLLAKCLEFNYSLPLHLHQLSCSLSSETSCIHLLHVQGILMLEVNRQPKTIMQMQTLLHNSLSWLSTDHCFTHDHIARYSQM